MKLVVAAALFVVTSACVPVDPDYPAATARPTPRAARQLALPQAAAVQKLGDGWLSGPLNDYNLSLDAAQRLLVFARSEPDFKNSRIWYSRKRENGWDAPAQAPFSDPDYRDSDPWLTPDGRSLYFVSNRPVGGGTANASLDIWRVAIEDGRFGAPEHLPSLASEGEELGPELHDGWLYFNSSRKGGPAKLAIYRARVRGDGFLAPQPLPAPFNDGAIQGDFTLAPNGRMAVFWSRRGESTDPDLFATCKTGRDWSAAVRLPPPINTAAMDFTPSFSADGKALYFASLRAPAPVDGAAPRPSGPGDLYVAPADLAIQAVHQAIPGADCGG